MLFNICRHSLITRGKQDQNTNVTYVASIASAFALAAMYGKRLIAAIRGAVDVSPAYARVYAV